MPCFHPVTAFRSRVVNPTGKRSLVFNPAEGLAGSELKIPCGGCIGCRIDRSQQWATRLMHEARYHDQKAFVTLTYDDLHLPADGSLDTAAHQLFFKRLRKHLNPPFIIRDGKTVRLKAGDPEFKTIKYFLCGEYGDSTGRPHYHAILYGVDFADRVKHGKNPQGDQYWRSDVLDQLWGLGHCLIGDVTHESCAYVSRYIMKKVTGDRAEEHYSRLNPDTGELIYLEPEFIRMSLKPAIGKVHYENFKSDFYPRDHAVVKGKQVPVPKYYDRLLERENPVLLEELKQARVTRAKSRKADSTPKRLKAREENLKAKLKTLTRPL